MESFPDCYIPQGPPERKRLRALRGRRHCKKPNLLQRRREPSLKAKRNHRCRLGIQPDSIDNIERKPQRSVKFGSSGATDPSNRLWIEGRDRHRDYVVATNHAGLGETFIGTDLNFRADTSDSARNRRTCNRCEDSRSGIPRQYAHGPSACGRSKISPVDLVTRYHEGAVRDASRIAD